MGPISILPPSSAICFSSGSIETADTKGDFLGGLLKSGFVYSPAVDVYPHYYYYSPPGSIGGVGEGQSRTKLCLEH